MTTSIRLFVSVLSVLACLRLGATPSYRVSLEGGAPDGTWTEKSSFAEAVRFCDNCADGVIELLADDEETLTGAVWLGVESGGTVTTAKPKLTIRSDSRGATRYTLKRAAAGSYMRLCQTCTEMTVVFTNIVLDGGAKWADKDNFLSTTQETGGIGCTSGYAFMVYGNVGRLHFAKDAILQNYAHPSGSVISFLYGTTTSHVYFDPGSLVRDCRGQGFLQDSGNVGSVFVDGATFTRCGSTTYALFLWYGTGAQTGRRVFHDAILTNNAVVGSGTTTGQGVVEVRNAAVVELTGNTVIKDNFLSNGTTPANFFAWGDTNLKVSAPLTSPAGSIGFKYKDLATATVGKKFGEVTDASHTDGAAFFWDGNSADLTVCGEVSGSDLVWRLNQIVYEAHPWVGYYDGKPHSPRVTVSQPETGAVVWYRPTDQDEWSMTSPSRTAVGSDTVRFKITASGIADVVGTVELTVWDPSYVPENKYRMRVDGGAWSLYKGLSDVETELWNLCKLTTGTRFEIELLCNDETTFTNRFVVGNYSDGHDHARTVTIRSSSLSGQRYVLKAAANAAFFYLGLPGSASDIAFTNIVFDGGAKWADTDDYKSLDQLEGGIVPSAGQLFYFRNKQTLRFGAGTVIRNCRCPGTGAGSLMPLDASGGRIFFDPGTQVLDCRGGCLTIASGSGYTLHLDGVTITRCSAKTHALFLLYENSTPKGDVVFNDTVITNNVVNGAGGLTGVGVIELRNKAQATFSGRTIIRDNLWKNGTAPADVFVWTPTNITATSTLRADQGAEIRVIGCADKMGTMTLGSQFGVAPAGLPPKSAQAFVLDANRKLVGGVEDGLLKWKKRNQGLVIVIR